MESQEFSRERRSTPRTITPLSTPAVTDFSLLRFPLKQDALNAAVKSALQEDGAFNDITTIATVVSDRRSRATLVARENGVICGVPLALEAFRILDAKASIRVEHEDGSRLKAGEPVLFVTGHARGHAALRQASLQPARQSDQQFVTGIVPETVVDAFEPVNIAEEHRNVRQIRSAILRQQLSKQRLHRGAVGKSGQFVVRGLVVQRFTRPAPFSDVLKYREPELAPIVLDRAGNV